MGWGGFKKLAGAKRASLYIGWSLGRHRRGRQRRPILKWLPKTKWLPNHKTDHNSLDFQARSSRFCMVVHIDLLQIIHFQKQNGRQIIKLIITHSIFSIIFLWILRFCCNWNSVKNKNKNPYLWDWLDSFKTWIYVTSKVYCYPLTQSIFNVGPPDFAW